jgi:hypothetical protein
LGHAVTIASRSSIKLCFRTGVIWTAHRLVPISWRYSLVSRFLLTKFGPRTTNLVKPTH